MMPQTGAARTILVADDDPSIRAMIQDILEDEGYAVRLAASGTQVLGKIREGIPDLILLDYMLPGLDGYEVVTELQKDEATRHIPVIIVTAQDGILYPQISRALGALHHLQKPFRTGELLELVASVLAT